MRIKRSERSGILIKVSLSRKNKESPGSGLVLDVRRPPRCLRGEDQRRKNLACLGPECADFTDISGDNGPDQQWNQRH